MDHNVVRGWLRSVLGPYALADRVYSHVDTLLLAFSSLAPKTEVYTYDDGRSALLLQVAGTIPITYRGATYHIPLALWLPHGYPREVPLAYVEPARGMAVRKGHKHVQLDGRVVVPSSTQEERQQSYLRRWERKWEACSLLELVQFLQAVFGADPPVYAVGNAGAGSSGAQAAQQQTGSASPRPQQQQQQRENGAARPASYAESDYRPGSSSAGSTNGGAGGGYNGRPPPALPGQQQAQQQGRQESGPAPPPLRPPKPGQAAADSSYSPRQAGPAPRSASLDWQSQAPSPYGQVQAQHSGQPPPQPGWPAHGPAHHPQHFPPQHLQSQAHRHSMPAEAYYHQGQGQGSGPSRGNSMPPEGSYTSSPVSPQQQQQHPSAFPPPHQYAKPPGSTAQHQHMFAHARNDHAGPVRQQSMPAYSSAAPPPAPARPPIPRDLLGEDEESSTSLPSTASQAIPSGPPPVRPPNPALLSLHTNLHHKLQARLGALAAAQAQERGQMQLLSADLERGHAAILDELARLEAVRDVCRVRAERMDATVANARERRETLQRKVEGELEAPGTGDDWVCATSIVGNQLIDLVAEDNAIEDTLYHLGRALNSERIDLDRFLKQTRFLAREQFLRRALAMKICTSLGWN